MADYTGQINWGNWQELPDYRAGWKDKHKSSISGIAKALDVTTYIPGANKVSDFVHEGADRVLTTGNQVLSPIVKFATDGSNKITGGGERKINSALGLEGAYDFIREKPVDALAVAAATYFTGGALGGAAAGGGGSAAGGAAAGGTGTLGAAGTTAAGTAITPAFASTATGAGVTAGAGAGAITPAFAASGLSIAPAAASGGLGAAGTAAANSLLTPAFASYGGASAGGGLLSSAKNLYGKFSSGKNYLDNIKTVADSDKSPTDRDIYNMQATDLAERIRNSYQPQEYKKKVAKQIMFNKFGGRS